MATVKNEIGNTYGHLEVFAWGGNNKHGQRKWWCFCHRCKKNFKEVLGASLRNGSTKSCGCLQRESASNACKLDLVDERFGRLVVIAENKDRRGVSESGKHRSHWFCLCDCGEIVSVSSNRLRSGNTRSCGCLQKDRVSEVNTVDIMGVRFGRLVVVSKCDERSSIGHIQWRCVCDCGEEVIVIGANLRSGNTTSCGCYFSEQLVERNWKDSLSDEYREETRIKPEYKEWRAEVFQRDNYTCPICGDDAGGNLVAHHLFSYNKFLNLRYVVCNGITWCEECHRKFHKKFGYGNNTAFQAYLFTNNMEYQI